jgi:hypothetical protein
MLPAETTTAVWRRTEVVVEREILTVHSPDGAAFVGECPQCGSEVLMLDAKIESSGSTIDPRRRQTPKV